MWRCKKTDEQLLHQFSKDLRGFRELKQKRWEKIDDEVQENIHPGSPSEDWIIPPDEHKTEQILLKDPEYVRLRETLLKNKPEVENCAHFLNVNTHHKLDWLIFKTPLIGNAALEDAIAVSHILENKCKSTLYFFQNLRKHLNF